MNKWLEEIPVFLDLAKAEINRYCSMEKVTSEPGNRHYVALKNAGNRVAKWANLAEIKQFYIDCPKGHEVDHIVPQKGDRVTGLHVMENLQYLTKAENREKSNIYHIK